jgi:hypothetical protein
MICLREIDDTLTGLVKKLNEVAAGNNAIDAFVILCSDDRGLEQRAKDLIDKHGIRSCAVSIAPPQGPPGFNVPREAHGTVVLYKDRVAKAAFCFTRDELTPTLADRIADAIEGTAETPYPLGYYAPAYTPQKAIIIDGFGSDKAALGPNPCVLIFSREVTPPVTGLVERLEEIAKDKAAKLDNFLVLVGEPKDLEPRLKDLAQERKPDAERRACGEGSALPFLQAKRYHRLDLCRRSCARLLHLPGGGGHAPVL